MVNTRHRNYRRIRQYSEIQATPTGPGTRDARPRRGEPGVTLLFRWSAGRATVGVVNPFLEKIT